MTGGSPNLREHYPEPTGRSVAKQRDRLDVHSRRFLSLCPFVVLATSDGSGCLDASPRGGPPGFIRVADDRTLWLPDAPGNNRLDSLSNITEVGRVGMLCLIPGVDETLRVNGRARIRDEEDLREAFADERRVPRTVLEITVEEVFLHCAKAFMRSRLWADDARQDRSVLPTMGEMLRDQTGMGFVETQDEMVARYADDL